MGTDQIHASALPSSRKIFYRCRPGQLKMLTKEDEVIQQHHLVNGPADDASGNSLQRAHDCYGDLIPSSGHIPVPYVMAYVCARLLRSRKKYSENCRGEQLYFIFRT
jgi:hypothetical protein